jgi:hypothetical protein
MGLVSTPIATAPPGLGQGRRRAVHGRRTHVGDNHSSQTPAKPRSGASTKPPAKRTRLRELEDIIKPGLASFVAVGTALAEIKRDKLYLVSHHNFEDYCRERWNLSTSHAYRQIEAAETQEELSPLGVKLRNEHAARLAKKFKTAIKARVQQGEDPDAVIQEITEQGQAWQRRERRLEQSDRQAIEHHSNTSSPIWDTSPLDQVLGAFRGHVLPLLEELDGEDYAEAIKLLRKELETREADAAE